MTFIKYITDNPNQLGAVAAAITEYMATLIKDGIKVATIEHLMSALAGLGIDNIVVEVDKEQKSIQQLKMTG